MVLFANLQHRTSPRVGQDRDIFILQKQWSERWRQGFLVIH